MFYLLFLAIFLTAVSSSNMPNKFTKTTKILNIGHLPGHTMGKCTILNANGFPDVESMLCENVPVEEIKTKLKSNPNSMFHVGGAMMQGFPDLMAELLAYIESDCKSILVHKTVKADFDEGIPFPPTEEQVNKSALNICLRYLAEGKEWPSSDEC